MEKDKIKAIKQVLQFKVNKHNRCVDEKIERVHKARVRERRAIDKKVRAEYRKIDNKYKKPLLSLERKKIIWREFDTAIAELELSDSPADMKTVEKLFAQLYGKK